VIRPPLGEGYAGRVRRVTAVPRGVALTRHQDEGWLSRAGPPAAALPTGRGARPCGGHVDKQSSSVIDTRWRWASVRYPLVEMWEWRRSRIKSCRPRSTCQLGRATQFLRAFLRPASESAPVGRWAALLRSEAGPRRARLCADAAPLSVLTCGDGPEDRESYPRWLRDPPRGLVAGVLGRTEYPPAGVTETSRRPPPGSLVPGKAWRGPVTCRTVPRLVGRPSRRRPQGRSTVAAQARRPRGRASRRWSPDTPGRSGFPARACARRRGP
jgi:hypothetical protein